MNTGRILLVLVLLVAIAGCATRRTPAPVVERNSSAVRAAKPAPSKPAVQQSGDYYKVQRGDTLYSIALENGADYRELAQWNKLEDPTKIFVGQQLRVTAPPASASASIEIGTVRVTTALESRPLESVPISSAPALPPSMAKVETTPPAAQAKPAPVPSPAKPAPAAAPPKAPAQEKAAPQESASLFIWPAKGKVLSEFAEPRRKGIDIAGNPGDPVVAAAAGRVTYIGTGIPGMGKLVVIKHDNGFITVYGHNREILVKEQQAVARGQKIAEIGSTDTERPKLHFQIRKGASAVDPLNYLPSS